MSRSRRTARLALQGSFLALAAVGLVLAALWTGDSLTGARPVVIRSGSMAASDVWAMVV